MSLPDKPKLLRLLATLAAGGRFGYDFHARDLDRQAEMVERGETLLPSYNWLHPRGLVASVRYAVSPPTATVDYLRALWLALGYDDGSLRAELVPLARAYGSAATATARARAGAAIAEWVRLRESWICRAFDLAFRGD